MFIAMGDSGVGLTHGTIAGMLITDMIMGRDNPWSILYDSMRKSPLAALTFAKENLNVAAQYSSWVTPGEVSSADEIQPGAGAVIRRGLSKIALFRDQQEICTNAPRFARTWGVSWRGILQKAPGIVPAMARDSILTERF
ncbi:MAG TPA: hypothetical protein VGO27_09395 [Candidatus Acidoferrum sp.]|nr:hypothetical protein [Candidatus Acidoferrum sp.]